MCLIILAWQVLPAFPLVVAANRDEFHARPSAPLAHWNDANRLIGGRDLEAGGTWMAADCNGRFAAITNIRSGLARKGGRSRGHLPVECLSSAQPLKACLQGIQAEMFAGFNLLTADQEVLWYRSSREKEARPLAPGIYGLSNDHLDTPWPKLLRAKQLFSEALPQLPETAAFLDLLADRTPVPDKDLPQTGVSLEWERLLSPVFICSETYGTRSSSILIRNQDGDCRFTERRFTASGEFSGETDLVFSPNQPN